MPGKSHLEGSRPHEIVCACGHRYTYVVTREVRTTYDGFALSQASADRKAREEAEVELQRLLDSAVEACKCPRCGAVTDEMRKKLEKDRANHLPHAVLKILGAAGLVLLAFWMWSLSQRSFDDKRYRRASRQRMGMIMFGGAGLLMGFGALTSLRSGYRDKFITAEVTEADPSSSANPPGEPNKRNANMG